MAGPTALPSGVVTFLFTDIEGSTRLAHELGEAWFGVLKDHHRVIRDVLPPFGGVEVSTAGDSFFVAFADAGQAIAATVAMQHAIAAHDWSPHPPIKVRMGVHTGEATLHDGDDYAGLTVHTASRVESAAAGAQVLITEATLAGAGPLPPGVDTLDLGMHRLKDLPAEVHIFQLVGDGLPREFPPIRSLDVIRNNVPAPASTFIGRAETLTKIHRALDEDRCLSLVGPGGAGKTRLSVQIATERLHRYKHGVWFVELDPARDEDGVATAIADAIGIAPVAGRSPLDTVLDDLAAKEVLLVVDNCEHVIDAAAAVIERALRRAPGMQTIATSREPLEIDGERVWPVGPLSLNGGPPESSEAVRLLLDRIERVAPEFELDDDAAAHAVAIARQLDGLPLALELAAATASSLALDEIAAQLDNRFELLRKGRRTALDRQKTLWGAIDWSYDLLDDAQRHLFRRLGVFPADFDYDTIAGVLGDASGLDVLVKKSLVTPTASGRLRMLESIRAYARQRLSDSGEAEALAEQHARWFAAGLLDPDGGPTWAHDLATTDLVRDDLIASLEWAIEHDADLTLSVLAPLGNYWRSRCRWTEAAALFDRALETTDGVESEDRIRALSFASEFARRLHQHDVARSRLEQAAAVALRAGGEALEQMVWADLGLLAVRDGDYDTAEMMLGRAFELLDDVNQPVHAALAMAHLSDVARQRGDTDVALDRAWDALQRAERAGAPELVLHVLTLLGLISRQRGERATARRVYDEAVRAATGVGATESLMYLSNAQANLALDLEEYGAAAGFLADAITVSVEVDASGDVAEALEGTARWAALTGGARAGRFLGAADAIRDELALPRAPAERDAYNALHALVRQSATFDDDYAAGRSLAIDDAVSEALGVLDVAHVDAVVEDPGE